MEIPDDLKLFLETRNSEQALLIWQYLDGTPDVALEMVQILVDGTPGLLKNG